MDFGALMFVTDDSMRPDDVAREVEARGFESLWFPEHTHIPASRKTPWPGGGELPREYSHTLDLFVALTAAATATKRLKVGSGICLVIERDPIVLAKEVATLDQLSNGRFLFGIGGGWNVEEMENHGTNFARRWTLLRERVEAMKVIWAEEAAAYQGQLVRFDPIWSWPKPAQRPHPPIYLGGHGPRALQRVIDYCDGWLPIAVQAGDLSAEIGDLHARAAAAGRDPLSVRVSVYGAPADAPVLRSYAGAGVERAVFSLPPAGADKVLPLLDRYARVVEELRAG
jgi:probable F420-dependent oxidoreductase